MPLRSLSLLPAELQLPQCRERRALNPKRTRKMRSIAFRGDFQPSHNYEPNQLDNFDDSEAFAAIFQEESVEDTELSYSCDAELDDELIGKAKSSPLFIQEREEPANLRQTYHSHEESLLPAQSFFTRTSTGRPVYEPSSNLSQKRKSSREMESERIRILLERQKEQILADVRTEIQKHEFQADSDRRSIQEFNGIIESQRMEIDHTITGCEQSRRDQLLLQEELSEQHRALRETRIRNMRDMEELQKSHVLKVEELSRRKLTEDQNTNMEPRAKIQELQNEVNCMNDSRDFKDAESVRSGPSHVPSQPALFPPYRDPGGLLSRRNQPPSIWDTHGISGNVFLNPPASSSSPYPPGHPGQGFNPWTSVTSEHTSPHVTSERQNPDTTLDPRCQSGPSARNSFDPSEGIFFKELWCRTTKTADFGSSL